MLKTSTIFSAGFASAFRLFTGMQQHLFFIRILYTATYLKFRIYDGPGYYREKLLEQKEIQEKYDIIHAENKTGVQQYEFHRWHIIYSIHM